MFHLRFPLFDEAGDSQGGGGAPAAPAAPSFDPTAFRTELKTELLGELRKDLNGIDKKFNKQFETFNSGLSSFKSELQGWLKPKEEQEQPAPEPAAPVNPAAAQPQAQKRQPSPEELAQQRELKDMREQFARLKEEAEKTRVESAKKEMHASLKTEISKFPFANEKGQADLFNLLVSSVQRGEDGNYYGPEGMGLSEYVQAEHAARPYWHPAKPVNGAGAIPPGAPTGSHAFDMDRIRPGMSAEERSQLTAALRRALPGS